MSTEGTLLYFNIFARSCGMDVLPSKIAHHLLTREINFWHDHWWSKCYFTVIFHFKL